MKQLDRCVEEQGRGSAPGSCAGVCHFTLHTRYCDVGMRVHAATGPACNLQRLSDQPGPYLCENIDIAVTVCVFNNTIQNFLSQTVLEFDAAELRG